jgi:orotate phosphoribosyltransferase
VDDVVSTTAALVRSKTAVQAAGYEVVGAYVILERDPHAREQLGRHGICLHSLFSLEQLRRLRAATTSRKKDPAYQ